jgi:FAD/FMN-containing dehydrogenase
MSTILRPPDPRTVLRSVLGERFSPGPDPILGSAAPLDEAELRKLILGARDARVRLVPRGAGSSPFHPKHLADALIVSTRHLNQVLEIDVEHQLAHVQAGLLWGDLMEQLGQRELMPRVYPSSAAFSTVGGFVATGGVGVGSFQYGSISDCVVSARIVRPNGDIAELAGSDLESATGLAGDAGIILDVVLRLQPLARMEPLVALFSRVSEVEGCIASARHRGLPLWSIGLMDRAAIELGARMRPDVFALPRGRYALLFSFRSSDRLQTLPRLRGTVLAAGGQIGAAGGSDHDTWVKRFMGLQGLGTTPVPMQFRFPSGVLSQVIRDVPVELRRHVAFEGVVNGPSDGVVVRFFLTDAHAGAKDAVATASQLLAMAVRHGGESLAEDGLHS